MNFDIDNFSSATSATILGRGREYYKRGCVTEITEVKEGHFEATVEGGDEYEVDIFMKGKVVVDHVCSCPYDYGPVCKHVVAVLYYIKEKLYKETKKPTSTDKIYKLLGAATKEQLANFLVAKANADKKLMHDIVSNFGKFMLKEPAEYKGDLKKALKKVQYELPYIVESALRDAANLLDLEHHTKALDICLILLEELDINLAHFRGGDAKFDKIEAQALDIIYQIAKAEKDEKARDKAFSELVQIIKNQRYIGHNLHSHILEKLAQLPKNTDEIKQILMLLEEPQETAADDYTIQKIKYNFLKNYNSSVAKKYLKSEINNPAVRNLAIELAIAKENYAAATKLAKNALKRPADEKYPTNFWLNQLLKIAILAQKQNKIIQYAQQLFISQNHFNPTYYELLKNVVPANDWPDFIQHIILTIKDIHPKNKQFIADILAAEKN